MGSLMPLPRELSASAFAGGTFTSVLIGFSCFSMILVCFDSAYGYQFRCLGSNAPWFCRFFPHIGNLNALQYGCDTLVHFAKRLTDAAASALLALSANGGAGSDQKGPINRPNHFQGRNRMRGPGQRVTAVGAMLRPQKPGLGQALKNLRQGFSRDAVGFGQVLGARCALSGVFGQVHHRHERIIGLLGELQHRPYTPIKSDPFPTVFVAYGFYDDGFACTTPLRAMQMRMIER